MSNFRYVNSVVQESPVQIGSGPGQTQIGTLLSEYEVREYWDLRQAPTPGVAAMRAYVVSLRQKITVCNQTANSFGALNPVTQYTSYPVLLVQQVQPSTSAQGLNYYVEDYSPKTLNAAVSVSSSAATSTDTANAVQRTAGSSSSVTNSFEISDSVGFFGDSVTGSVTASAGYSTTDTTEASMSRGQTNSSGAQRGSGSGMTIKDWASYAFLDQDKQQPSWVWGQEYPWNVINFRNASQGSNQITIPGYVQQRLWDGQTLYPPSDLSQFGLDFTATARWIFYVSGTAGSADEQVTFDHAITYWEGSHSQGSGNPVVVPAQINVMATDQNVDSVTLNLPVLSLAPIVSAESNNGAVVGFVNSEFICAPLGPTSPFRLKSSANNIYATGAGFDQPVNNDSIFTANNAASATITLQFKVVDTNLDLSLYIKHWMTSAGGCLITAAINEANPSQPLLSVNRHVDALEGGSGDDNVTVITLRNKDYNSSDFNDYLVMGLNTIVLTITPNEGQSTCDYAIRAIAIC